MPTAKSVWWNADDWDLLGQCTLALNNMRASNATDIANYYLARKRYGEKPWLDMGEASRLDEDSSRYSSQFNVVATAIDTLQAKICKDSPSVLPVTDGADWEGQQKAEGLRKFLAGASEQFDITQASHDVVQGALIGGVAGIYFDDSGDSPLICPVSRFQLLADCKGYSLSKRFDELFLMRWIDRTELAELYPDAQDEIERAGVHWEDTADGFSTGCNLVRVVDCWKLGKRHVRFVDTGVLVDEEWDSKDFPVAMLSFIRQERSPFGRGVADRLWSFQREIDETLQQIRDGRRSKGSDKLLVHAATQIVESDLDNNPWNAIRYNGNIPPALLPGRMISPDIYQWVWDCKRAALEEVGISPLDASGQKPMGINSGRGLRVMTSITTERFFPFATAYQRFCVNAAKALIACVSRIAERGIDVSVDYSGDDSIESLDWANVDLEKDAYKLRIAPVSALTGTPSERLATAQDLLAAQAIDANDFWDIAQLPDLNAKYSVKRATANIVNKHVSIMLNHGETCTPESAFDLQTAFQIVRSNVALAQIKGAPEDRVELLRGYIEAINYLINQQGSQQ